MNFELKNQEEDIIFDKDVIKIYNSLFSFLSLMYKKKMNF